jgi:hypothetical protein
MNNVLSQTLIGTSVPMSFAVDAQTGIQLDPLGTLSATKSGAEAIFLRRLATDGNVASFWRQNAAVGSISVTAAATAYNTASDETLKDDLGEMSIEDAMKIILLWKFHDFTWKVNGDADHGVFAQELYKVYPRAVTPGGWRTDLQDGPDGEKVEHKYYQPWSVDYSKLVTPIGRATQGVIAKQDDLDARLRRLEKQ